MVRVLNFGESVPAAQSFKAVSLSRFKDQRLELVRCRKPPGEVNFPLCCAAPKSSHHHIRGAADV